MTNDEYFNEKPMKEAIAKWREDCEKGFCGDIEDWLETPFMDFSKGKLVRGRFFTHEQIEEKIRKMENRKVTGYLLEWKDEKGNWFGSEFEPENVSDDSNRHDLGDGVSADWFDNDVCVGFFKELPEVWLSSSDDWDFRLGVDFNAETTPVSSPSESGVWDGVSNGGCGNDGDPWRVRKVTVGGSLSDTAKEFFRRNPDVEFDYTKE